jgi:hypothetical protein
LAVVVHTRLCPAYRFRAGDAVTATDWRENMEDVQGWLRERKVWLNLDDLGLGPAAVMSWHGEPPKPHKYLFKLKLTSRVRAALVQVPEGAW